MPPGPWATRILCVRRRRPASGSSEGFVLLTGNMRGPLEGTLPPGRVLQVVHCLPSPCAESSRWVA